MTPVKKHTRILSRTLLIAGYFFLFATQFNGRFYSAANFFEYGHSRQSMAMAGKRISSPDRTAAVPAYKDTRNNAHLGLDKRYSAKQSVKLPFTDFPVIASYEVIRSIYAIPLKVYSTADIPTNALRGPPCA